MSQGLVNGWAAEFACDHRIGPRRARELDAEHVRLNLEARRLRLDYDAELLRAYEAALNTFAAQQWEAHRAAGELWGPLRLYLQRRLRKLDGRMAKRRDNILRRWGIIP